MSLLRKASIVTTPTSYENGKILSVKPSIPFGEELISCGDFECASPLDNWTNNSDGTISVVNGKLKVLNVSGRGRAFRTITGLNAGSTYSFYVENTSEGSVTGFCHIDGNNNIPLNANYIFIASASSITLQVGVGNATAGDFTFFDNITLKRKQDADFQFTRNSSATRVNSQGLIEDMQILSGDLVSNGDFSQIGSELVTNGDFATDSDWNKGTGWSISNSKAIYTGTSNSDLSQNGILTSGKLYKLEYKIISSTLVNGIVKLSGTTTTTQNQLLQTQGTHTLNFIANGTAPTNFNIRIVSNTSGQFEIDNVSVKEVGQDWTLGTGWSIGVGVAIATSVSTGIPISQSIVAGKKYKITYEVVSLSQGAFQVDLSFSGTALGQLVTTTGTFTDIVTSINPALSIRAVGTTTGSITNISLIEITEDTNLPRIDYTGGVGHWLFEPQRTNSLLQSNQFNESEWSKTNTSVSANETGVGGSTDAWLLSKNSSNALIRQFITTTGANSFSVYVKKGSLSWVRLFIASSTESSSVYVNLDNGLTGTSSGSPTVKVIPMDNGWYRCIITKDTTNINNFRIYPADADNDISGTSGNIYIQYAQLEQSSFATSYIPTSGSQVTRLQDAAFGAGSSDLINSTEGVLYAEIAALTYPNITNNWLTITDGTAANSVGIVFETPGTATGRVEVGGANQAYISTSIDYSNILKVAVKYKENDFSFWINGVKIGADASGVTFPLNTLNSLQFSYGAGSNKWMGKTRCVAVFKEALTDAELTCLTTI